MGQVQGHEEAVPGPAGAPQYTVISAPLLQSHVSLRPQGQNYPQITSLVKFPQPLRDVQKLPFMLRVCFF